MSRRAALGLVLCGSLVAAAAGSAAPKAPPNFLCSLVGDELRIRIDKPHGRELAIVAPNGVLYLLAFEPRTGAPEPPHPPFTRFSSAHELSVDARTLEGWRFQAGKQRWETIFGGRGSYQLRVADDVVGNAGAAGDPGIAFCVVTRK